MLRCPSCGSSEIYPVVGGYIGQVYLCKACRYRGSLVVEVDEDEPEREGD
jgi:transposase-like protein